MVLIVSVYMLLYETMVSLNLFYVYLTHRRILHCSIAPNPLLKHWILTWGLFWPAGIVVASICLYVSVCLCANPEFVCMITCDPFKPGSSNLDHRCKDTLDEIPVVLGEDWFWPSFQIKFNLKWNKRLFQFLAKIKKIRSGPSSQYCCCQFQLTASHYWYNGKI